MPGVTVLTLVIFAEDIFEHHMECPPILNQFAVAVIQVIHRDMSQENALPDCTDGC